MKVMRHLDFRKGFIYLGNNQMFHRPLDLYFIFYFYLEKIFEKKELIEILDDSVMDDCYAFYDYIKNDLNIDSPNKSIQTFLNVLTLMGFGEVNLKFIFEEKIIFTQKKFFASKMYKDTFGKYPNCEIEYILKSFIQGYLSILFSKKVEVEFSIVGGRVKYVANLFDEAFDFKPEKFYNDKVEQKELSKLPKSIIYKNLLRIDDGVLSMDNIENYTIPYFTTFYILEKMYLKYSECFEKFMRDYGIAIATSEMDWLIPKNQKNDKAIFIKRSELADLDGLGNIEYFDEDNYFLVKFEQNFDYYKQYFNNDLIESFKIGVVEWLAGCVMANFRKKVEYNYKNDMVEIKLLDETFELNETQEFLFSKMKFSKKVKKIRNNK